MQALEISQVSILQGTAQPGPAWSPSGFPRGSLSEQAPLIQKTWNPSQSLREEGEGREQLFLGPRWLGAPCSLSTYLCMGWGKQGNLGALKGSDGTGTHHLVLIMYSPSH